MDTMKKTSKLDYKILIVLFYLNTYKEEYYISEIKNILRFTNKQTFYFLEMLVKSDYILYDRDSMDIILLEKSKQLLRRYNLIKKKYHTILK